MAHSMRYRHGSAKQLLSKFWPCRVYGQFGQSCMTLSALFLLVSFSVHVVPSTSSGHALASAQGLHSDWSSTYQTDSAAGEIRERISRSSRRRHRSRKPGTKLQHARSMDPDIVYRALGSKGPNRSLATGNGSDVSEVHEQPGLPEIWDTLQPQVRQQKEDDDLPAWQQLPSMHDISRFKTLVQRTMACRGLPALTLALVKRGRVVLRAGLGYADPEQHVPVSRSTRFAIGSLTKAFTATLVSELLSRHNLSVDTAINQLLPDNFQLMDEVRTHGVTVRDLLGHRTGVPGYFHALLMGFPAQVTRPELVRRLRYLPPVVPLRYQFLYNNYLYTLAAHVVEELTGRSWEALVRDVILRPLQMNSTGFVDKVKDFSHFALPCASRNGTLKNLLPELLFSVSPCGPAGSLYSTAGDMTRWLLALLSGGKAPDGSSVLQESALRETTRAVMPPPCIGTDLTKPTFPVSDVEQSYGMGWVTSNYRGYRKVWHSGGIVTYSSRLWLLPGVQGGLFVATNGPQTRDKGHALTAITSMAADLLLGEPLWLNQTTICTFPAPWKPLRPPPDTPAPPDPLLQDRELSDRSGPREDNQGHTPSSHQHYVKGSLDQLLGVYTHRAFGDITIQRSGTDITARDVNNDKGDNFDAVFSESENTSQWLSLKYGRFGQLKLKRVAGDLYEWEGWFEGPLWYVTASDDNTSPIRVRFLQDEDGRVDRILYPIDGKYDDIAFQKRHSDVMSSNPYSASSGGWGMRSALVTVSGVWLLQIRLILFLCS